jgi:parvulin-like peptidyl-prolyl isomerase
VTFDGGSQNTPMAHWVGKMLSTSNENEAIGILRMLACGSNDAFSEVDKKYNDTEKSVLLLNKIIVLRKESARKILEENNYSNQEINNILELTHCNPPNNYVIASKDMVAKSGVWAHFGAWDFNRAKIWALTRSMSLYERREFLMNEFNKTSQEATDISNEIEKVLKSEDTERAANDWITGWPSYISQDIISCKNGENNTISCPINIVISQQGNSRDVISSFKLNLLTRENYFEINRYNGNSLQGRGEILPNEVYIVSFDETFVSLGNKDNENQKANIDVVLVPGQSNTYHAIVSDPKISTSMFTRMFFLQGFGLKQFEQTGAYQSFTTGNVFVYKTDFKEYEEEVSASHILLKFEKNKTEEQVLNEIKQVQKKLTLENFENIAKNVSEDMASAINGGDLGWVKKGTMVEEFENALFNAENNTIIGPIKTDFGYHLIKIKDKRKNYFAE